ncbi:MAG: hypothetical protein AAGC85_17605 [Bacteroidota bacterium]
MKAIKSNIITLSLIAILGLIACEKEELTLEEPSHQVIFTSEMDFQNTIEINGKISFGDVSAGVESRVWTFPEGVADILDSDNDVTSSEENVHAIFLKTGEHQVNLKQTFKKEAFVGNSLSGRELDTTIVVTVLDSIQASIQAFYINEDGSVGEELNLADASMNVLPASEVIRFMYTGTGEPETYSWTFEGGSPETVVTDQPEIDVKYKFLGEFDISLVASRSRPFGTDELSINRLVEVVPSDKPLAVEQIVEKDGDIAVVFSREVNPATLLETDFTVAINTSWEVLMPSFSSVRIDPTEGNIVMISLANEAIYNDDEVTVSFLEGNLFSLDGVAAVGFADELLTFPKTNLLASSDYDYSFENYTTDNWAYLGWGDPWDKYSLNISSDQSYEGGSSAYIEFGASGGMIVGLKDDNGEDVTFPASNGKSYELGVWVYVESLGNNNPDGLVPDLRLYWGPDTNWGIGGNPFFEAEYPVGEWTYSSAYIEFAETGDKTLMLRGFNGANAESLKMYIDNICLSEVNLRPR